MLKSVILHYNGENNSGMYMCVKVYLYSQLGFRLNLFDISMYYIVGMALDSLLSLQ